MKKALNPTNKRAVMSKRRREAMLRRDCGHTTSVLRSFDQTTSGKAGPRNYMVPKSASGGLEADSIVTDGRRSSMCITAQSKTAASRDYGPSRQNPGNRSPCRRCVQAPERDGSLPGHDMGLNT